MPGTVGFAWHMDGPQHTHDGESVLMNTKKDNKCKIRANWLVSHSLSPSESKTALCMCVV